MSSPSSQMVLEDLLAHSGWMRRLARRLVRDEATAEDLVQETWLAALSSPPPDTRNLRGWLARVLGNRARDAARSSYRRDRREEAAARPEELPSEHQVFEDASRAQEVASEVLALDEPYRSVLLLRFWRDMKPSEIARELERPKATVNTQLQRGMERLRLRLEKRYGGRDAWIAALVPLCKLPAESGLVSATSASTFGWIASVWAAAGLVLLGAIAWSVARPFQGEPVGDLTLAEALQPAGVESGPLKPAAAIQALPSADTRHVAGTGNDADPNSPPDPVVAPRFASQLQGRVVDLDGRGVPGVTVVWQDPNRLRWADDSRTAITGASVWIPVPESVREDPGAWEEFAKERLPEFEAGLQLLSGQELPRTTALTDRGGWFEFEVPGRLTRVKLEHSTLGFLGKARLVQELGGDPVYVVGPRYELSGRVLGLDGRVHPNVEIELIRSAKPLPQSVFDSPLSLEDSAVRTRSDQAGHFEFRGVALAGDVILQASVASNSSASDSIRHEIALGQFGPSRRLDGLELRTSPQIPTWTVTGRVLGQSGSPAVRATVQVAELSTFTDGEGRYSIELPRYSLHADDREGHAWLAAQTLQVSRWGAETAELSLGSHVPSPGWNEVALPDVWLEFSDLPREDRDPAEDR